MGSVKKTNLPNLELEPVQRTMRHKKILFKLFNSRRDDLAISSNGKLTFEKHCSFVDKHPYRFWFIIKKKQHYVGTTYITFDNHLGVYLDRVNNNLLRKVLETILLDIVPLPTKPSVRAGGFHINVSVRNEEYSKILEDMGAKPYQKTYRFMKGKTI